MGTLGANLIRYWDQFDDVGGKLTVAVVSAVLRGGSAALLALSLRDILAEIVAHAALRQVIASGFLAIVSCAMLGTFGYATRRTVAVVTQAMMRNLRRNMVDRLLSFAAERLS